MRSEWIWKKTKPPPTNAVPIRLIHDRWVSKFAEPWADLRSINLYGVDVSNVDFSEAELIETILAEAILHGVFLYRIRLQNADLTGADLTNAVLNRSGSARIRPHGLHATSICGWFP